MTMDNESFLPLHLPLNFDREMRGKLDIYLDMLTSWNKALNLVGFSDKNKIASGLIQDSFYLAHFLQSLFNPHWRGLSLDFGAGAGLPGIPLRMVWTQGQYIMIEARQKRALFLNNVLARINLPHTAVYHGQAQKFLENPPNLVMPYQDLPNGSPRFYADCILSRAFMPWEKLLPFCSPYLAANGLIIVMANQITPELPDGWQLVGQYDYCINNEMKKKWLWALSKN